MWFFSVYVSMLFMMVILTIIVGCSLVNFVFECDLTGLLCSCEVSKFLYVTFSLSETFTWRDAINFLQEISVSIFPDKVDDKNCYLTKIQWLIIPDKFYLITGTCGCKFPDKDYLTKTIDWRFLNKHFLTSIIWQKILFCYCWL